MCLHLCNHLKKQNNQHLTIQSFLHPAESVPVRRFIGLLLGLSDLYLIVSQGSVLSSMANSRSVHLFVSFRRWGLRVTRSRRCFRFLGVECFTLCFPPNFDCLASAYEHDGAGSIIHLSDPHFPTQPCPACSQSDWHSWGPPVKRL